MALSPKLKKLIDDANAKQDRMDLQDLRTRVMFLESVVEGLIDKPASEITD